MQIEFDLLANAEDSIRHAIDNISYQEEPNDARRLKQAIRDVAHGIELLLKEKLRRVHPVLIWENIDKFPNLAARTVTVDTAISRLGRIGGLKFDPKDVELITSLRDTRNAVEHYAWKTTKLEAERVVGETLGFAIYFAKEELGTDFLGYAQHRNGTVETLLENSPAFANAFRARYEKAAHASGEFATVCSYCGALAVSSSGACKACGHWQTFDEDEIPL
jgi:hypothetical protein